MSVLIKEMYLNDTCISCYGALNTHLVTDAANHLIIQLLRDAAFAADESLQLNSIGLRSPDEDLSHRKQTLYN